MASVYVPYIFRKSCENHASYPLKLVDRARYGQPLLAHSQDRFNEQQRQLHLFSHENKLFIPYWDVSQSGVVEQRNILSERELTAYLGLEFEVDPQDKDRVLRIKPDPQCRFIFLSTPSSAQPLELTASALKKILSYHQVMPCLLDFLYCFGGRDAEDRELTRFSGFRTEKTLHDPRSGLDISALKRSGRRYQICYTLKSVSLHGQQRSKAVDKTWRLRSAVIYHQFDVQTGTQQWIIGDPLQEIHSLIQEHVHEKKDHSKKYGTFAQSFASSLNTHLLYARWATEEWRWHVQSSEEIIDRLTERFVRIHPDVKDSWEPNDLVIIQEREEHLCNTIMALESTEAIFRRLRAFYKDLVQDPAWPQNEVATAEQNVKEFVSQLDEYIYDIGMQADRARLAARLAQNRKEILIHHLSAQNAQKQNDLAEVMYKHQGRSVRDALAMRIITLITLIYLPMTFVSTFFSTDVVKYQDDGHGDDPAIASEAHSPSPPVMHGEFSPLAMQRFFEVSIPLMVLTLGLAYWWYRREKASIDRIEQPLKLMV